MKRSPRRPGAAFRADIRALSSAPDPHEQQPVPAADQAAALAGTASVIEQAIRAELDRLLPAINLERGDYRVVSTIAATTVVAFLESIR